ncbi:MAG: N-acetyltransferase [Nitrospirota bacterium]|nr:N-acetyltransferase [Nitrospirota bacterium]
MIRKAKVSDVKDIQKVISAYAEKGEMLQRSAAELHESLRDFYVYEEEGRILGVGALHLTLDGLAEVRSLAVLAGHTGNGYGRELVNACLADARDLGVKTVFTLTYQPGFFKKMGFSEIDKHQLPHKIWNECVKCFKFPDCDEVALTIAL